MSTSVIIPVYGRFDLLHQLLFDLYKNCSLIEEVIIVNDKPDDADTRNGLMWWKSTNMLPIEVIETKENLGFLLASNLGMKQAVEDVVILISTDVRVQSDIIESLRIVDSSSSRWFAGGKLYTNSTGWNDFNGRIFGYLEGWLLAGKREAWNDLGYFDERYAPCDFEDVDISTTALEKGYMLHSLELDCNLTHLSGQSIGYSAERENITKINRKKFEEKWLKQ